MPVQKLVLQVTIMCATDTLHEAVDAYSSMTLSEIEEAINFGEDIGSQVTVASAETITVPDQVTVELQKIGNDGTFFDHELGRVPDLLP